MFAEDLENKNSNLDNETESDLAAETVSPHAAAASSAQDEVNKSEDTIESDTETREATGLNNAEEDDLTDSDTEESTVADNNTDSSAAESQADTDAASTDDESAPKWYVLHTYSGYEKKVQRTIQQIVRNRNLENYIFKVEVPEEEVIEVRDGKKKTTTRKIFPGYVLIKMLMDDDVWYLVRNVHGVTGFVGPDAEPIPLRDDELAMMGVETDWVPDVDYEVGDSVRIINGPLESFIGRVEVINYEKKKVELTVSMFGRETPVELDFTQVMSV